jgi:hypothetical protein
MREFVAVNGPFTLLKMRDALMFSRIEIPRLNEAFLGVALLDEIRPLIGEIGWLSKEEIVFEHNFPN